MTATEREQGLTVGDGDQQSDNERSHPGRHCLMSGFRWLGLGRMYPFIPSLIASICHVSTGSFFRGVRWELRGVERREGLLLVFKYSNKNKIVKSKSVTWTFISKHIKRSKEGLSVMVQTHSMQIFGVIPFVKLQNDA